MKPYESEMGFDLKMMKWDTAGLIPAVVQDKDGEILMVAYMNNIALEETISTGYGTYYSRSRQKLWRKGESSGNRQKVLEIKVDCDLDCIILKVEQVGGACHTGYYSCFYRTLENRVWKISAEPVFNPEEVYGK
ncbi:MAG: phosphoribosyl-AMP cyclohydrolase [bacterium]